MLENTNQLKAYPSSKEPVNAEHPKLPMMGASLLKVIPPSDKIARQQALNRIFNRLSGGSLFAYNYSFDEPYNGGAEDWLRTRLEYSDERYYCGPEIAFNLKLVDSPKCPLSVLSSLCNSLKADLKLAQTADPSTRMLTKHLVQAAETAVYHGFRQYLRDSKDPTLEEWLEEEARLTLGVPLQIAGTPEGELNG
jgi:hypothetical protein